MTDLAILDRRPIVVAIAGPNGAGKTTFYRAHLVGLGLRFVNADVLAAELDVGPYKAAELADAVRERLLAYGESFVFETVFSDPVGAKIAFLERAAQQGYTVALCFVGLCDEEQSIARVAMRVSQGGHDVPDDRLLSRFPRVMDNLAIATRRLPHVLVFDNSDLGVPFRHVATFEGGAQALHGATPAWLERVLAP
jgi:predicted ABC-type ATPase